MVPLLSGSGLGRGGAQPCYEIKKSLRLEIEVSEEDTSEGWSMLTRLDEEVALRAPVRRVGTEEVASISRHRLAGGAGGTVLVREATENLWLPP